MRPFSLGVTTLIQGVYALAWVVVLFDVASPTLNLREMPELVGNAGRGDHGSPPHRRRGPGGRDAHDFSWGVSEGEG